MNKFVQKITRVNYVLPTKVINYDYNTLRKVISFSLYGKADFYIDGLLENCIQINKIYPDFWIYVYLGNDFDISIFKDKFNLIKNLVWIETGKSGHEVMSYRFFSIDRDEVGISFSRDCDSRINARDQYCINEFIKSDKKFQIIRDCLSHGIHILGGMWGIKKGLLDFKIQDVFNRETRLFEYGTDQTFLSKYIYPAIKNNAIIFDEYFKYPEEKPVRINAPMVVFPTGPDYVGRVWDSECWYTYI